MPIVGKGPFDLESSTGDDADDHPGHAAPQHPPVIASGSAAVRPSQVRLPGLPPTPPVGMRAIPEASYPVAMSEPDLAALAGPHAPLALPTATPPPRKLPAVEISAEVTEIVTPLPPPPRLPGDISIAPESAWGEEHTDHLNRRSRRIWVIAGTAFVVALAAILVIGVWLDKPKRAEPAEPAAATPTPIDAAGVTPADTPAKPKTPAVDDPKAARATSDEASKPDHVDAKPAAEPAKAAEEPKVKPKPKPKKKRPRKRPTRKKPRVEPTPS